jgi:peptidyl-prolyl cis-trans isomerase-like 4
MVCVCQARLFEDEIRPHLKHRKRGLLGMAGDYGGVKCAVSSWLLLGAHKLTLRTTFAGAGQDMNGSQFYITTGESLHSLDEKVGLFSLYPMF